MLVPMVDVIFADVAQPGSLIPFFNVISRANSINRPSSYRWPQLPHVPQGSGWCSDLHQGQLYRQYRCR
jgi:hypothetical protein